MYGLNYSWHREKHFFFVPCTIYIKTLVAHTLHYIQAISRRKIYFFPPQYFLFPFIFITRFYDYFTVIRWRSLVLVYKYAFICMFCAFVGNIQIKHILNMNRILTATSYKTAGDFTICSLFVCVCVSSICQNNVFNFWIHQILLNL